MLKAYNQKILVNRITGEVKYIWQPPTAVRIYGREIPESGDWIPIYDDGMKTMWQEIYNRERSPKKP